ncbi:MAG: type II toxin-antitoxin system PemK/MazF family toxin [Verrucomicrobia bacterium]|jgi:mRNA interferase MazF|nr:type II toxin-antitoxin system PemK/MazF family toxin [Verrucomicrobiota bacterium]
MEGLVAGDVVVVPFPFTDLTSQKVRPALVLASLDRGDVLLCQITSKPFTHRHLIRVDEADFCEGALPRQSYLLPQRLVTASKGIVRRRAGKITERKLSDIRHAVCQVVRGEI